MSANGGCSRAINLFLIWSFLPNSFQQISPPEMWFGVKCGLARGGWAAQKLGESCLGKARRMRRKMVAGCGGCVASSWCNNKSPLSSFLPNCQADGFLIFEFHHFNLLLFCLLLHFTKITGNVLVYNQQSILSILVFRCPPFTTKSLFLTPS